MKIVQNLFCEHTHHTNLLKFQVKCAIFGIVTEIHLLILFFFLNSNTLRLKTDFFQLLMRLFMLF